MICEGGEFEAAADRIGEAVEECIATAGLETLQSWLGQLPEEIMGSRAKMLYARGRILYFQGYWEEAAAWFTRTKERAQVEDDRPIFSLALRFLTGSIIPCPGPSTVLE